MRCHVVNCRKQKMKCIAGKGDTCRRCHRSNLPCIFLPRANAATLPGALASSIDDQFKNDVLRRLRIIEGSLELPTSGESVSTEASDCGIGDCGDDSAEYAALSPLWDALRVLEKSSPKAVSPVIWRKGTIGYLWSSYVAILPRSVRWSSLTGPQVP